MRCSLSLLLGVGLVALRRRGALAVVPPGAYPGSVHDSSQASPSAAPRAPWGRRPTAAPSSAAEPTAAPASTSSWSAMLTVDPSKILSHLVERGGLVLPADAARQLRAARRAVHVQAAELNVVSRDLVLRNLTVGLPGADAPAARVGLLHVRWDSYRRPTLEVRVEDVEVLVEFTNVLLTESNWQELRAAGFPPEILMDTAASVDAPSGADDDDSFVRFHDINIRGTFTIRVASRPLGKDIGTMTLNLRELRGLSREIQALSDRNRRLTGRAGCTQKELSETIASFLNEKIRAFVKARVEDLAKDPKAVFREAEELVNRASDGVMNYVKQAGRVKGNELQESAVERLKSWGVPNAASTISALQERALYGVERLNVSAAREFVNKEAAGVLESLQEMRENLRNLDKRDDETEIVFADW